MAERYGSPSTRQLEVFHGGRSSGEHTTSDPAPAADRYRWSNERDIPDGRTRSAVLGEWGAVWQRDRHGIRIIRVRNISDERTLYAVTDPGSAPDLAEMRERFPELSALWDVIRHQFWTLPAQEAR